MLEIFGIIFIIMALFLFHILLDDRKKTNEDIDNLKKDIKEAIEEMEK
jgi:regulatory protein YycI of two-component signal transduction system YycFG